MGSAKSTGFADTASDQLRTDKGPDHIDRVFDQLLSASKLVGDDQRITLTAHDISTALTDMHLQPELPTPDGVTHPSNFLPTILYSGAPVDVTDLVQISLREVLAAHPIFHFMAEQTIGNDDFHKSIYFGGDTRDDSSLDFPQLCRRQIASIYLFESLIALDRDGHRKLAQWYEALFADAKSRSEDAFQPRSTRYALMGFWLGLKGESVLASINAFEMLRRLSSDPTAAQGTASSSSHQDEVKAISDILNAIMRFNILEAVVSNLSFAFWPDNARAGMALLLSPLGNFRKDLTQDLDADWFTLYLAWNANFIWPSHYCPDMMCFSMLATPAIALAKPEVFQYNRAHSLFWVVRSNQLTRMLSTTERAERAAAFGVTADLFEKPVAQKQVPCFHCRQLEPANDRQPLTSRTAVLTRESGEALAKKAGLDVSESSDVWRQLATQVVPQQIWSALQLYRKMPKSSATKLKLL